MRIVSGIHRQGTQLDAEEELALEAVTTTTLIFKDANDLPVR